MWPTTSSSSRGAISTRRNSAIPSGISAFIVERGFTGFSSGTLKEKWGILAGNTGFFKMDEVEVPAGKVASPTSLCTRSAKPA